MRDFNGDLCTVRAVDVSRTYKQGAMSVDALKHATCVIRPAAKVAIMGASGSGKSTLLHLMAGLDLPSSGQIVWPTLRDGDELVPGHVSIAFQAPSLVPFLNAAENIALPRFVLGDVKLQHIVVEELERFGVADLADKLPDELSGGQAQRVVLARATATRPQLLLADEPTGQLDRATGHKTVAALIGWAQANNSALVVATHDREVAEAFDEVWHMEHGRIVNAIGDSRTCS